MRTVGLLALGLVMLTGCPDPRLLAVGPDGKPNPKATAQVLNNHANGLDDAGKHAEAVIFYKAALERYGPSEIVDRAGAHYNLGLAYRRMGNNEKAVEHYARAIELDPADPKAYINIGPALIDLGQIDEAISRYLAGLEQQPDSQELVENLATAYIREERHAEALPIVRKAYRLRKQSLFGGTEHTRWLMRWIRYLEEHDPAWGRAASRTPDG